MYGKGRNRGNRLQQKRLGSSSFGLCICPQCNYTHAHKRGEPCSSLICPNCKVHLVRQTSSENKKIQPPASKAGKSSGFPVIDEDLCTACGACIEKCPCEAISLVNDKANINTNKCKMCRACVKVCPVEAIT